MRSLQNNPAVTGGFWARWKQLNQNTVLPYQLRVLWGKEPGLTPEQESPVIRNFLIAAGRSSAAYQGEGFYDSDLAKWLEAAAHTMRHSPDAALEREVDMLIDLAAEAQWEDGYIGTYFQVLDPEQRLRHFGFSCELYSIGHFMEAAAAHFGATGKKKLLILACKAADLLCATIGPDKEKSNVYDGHPEIELGLICLYRVTGKQGYLDLAQYFVLERGRQPCFLLGETGMEGQKEDIQDKWFGPDHHLAHMPVKEQVYADGHAVKRMYLSAAMADLVLEGRDPDGALLGSLKAVWENMVNHRMYITGGIGSQGYAERFTVDDDLPDDRPYAETCASIGLVFWAHRMSRITHHGKYADELERALYNGVLSGLGANGTNYFYTNPLYLNPSVTSYREDNKCISVRRQKWFHCACCPPNIARLLGSLEDYIYVKDGDTLFVDIYVQNRAAFVLGGSTVALEITTGYPWDGIIHLECDMEQSTQFTLALRIPSYCGDSWTLQVNDAQVEWPQRHGYLYISRHWNPGDTVTLTLDLTPRLVVGRPTFRAVEGRAALMAGPVVYCLEEEDNGDLAGLRYTLPCRFTGRYDSEFLGGAVVLYGQGESVFLTSGAGPYADATSIERTPVQLKAIPYHLWANRSVGQMAVWLPVGQGSPDAWQEAERK